jgi:phenylacetic acid degradation operon negative regulatory protein
VPENQRAIRHQVRTRLAWAGFGSLGGGVWISPHVAREHEIAAAQRNGSAAELLSFQAELGALGEPRKVIAEAWDLERIEAHYRDFLADFGRLRPGSPERTFAAQTAMVHAWRKFPFLDPDLPDELLPKRWPRKRAHDLFQDRHARWHQLAQDYFSELED